MACRGGHHLHGARWPVDGAGRVRWIPGGIAQAATGSPPTARSASLFVEPGAARPPSDCCTLALSPLVLELILHRARNRRTIRTTARSHVWPGCCWNSWNRRRPNSSTCRCRSNRGLRRIADELTRAPGDRASMAEWARRVAMSERSLARMVRRETGMTFGQWRQQLQIIIALQQLVRRRFGATHRRDPRLRVGHASFIGMFRKALGSPPARYVRDSMRRPAD
ncbi:AraC family transcriptional regulator [Pseudomonas aeruginosa]|nr:AraC family transcriptional regulator [Pseudomonas aeruginosa]